MVVRTFPPIERADENGILAVGGDLEVETLLLAYRQGIFPWPVEDCPLLWWALPKRAVLFPDELHVSKSLAKEIKRGTFEVRFNQNFRKVIEKCAASLRGGQKPGTWITQEMIEGYCSFFNAGYAYSVEAYRDEVLCGGIYGVSIGRFVSAESMYYDEPNASKVCLHFLVDHLKANEIEWVDFQALNPFTKELGAKEIERERFMTLLQAVIEDKGELFPR